MRTLFALIVVMVSGCYGYDVTVRTAPISRGAYPPPNDRFVEVYFYDAGPAKTRRHEQICVIEVTGAKDTPLSELLFEMRKKAAQIGADAVIQAAQQPHERSAGNMLLDLKPPEGYEREVYHATRLSGIAIKYQ